VTTARAFHAVGLLQSEAQDAGTGDVQLLQQRTQTELGFRGWTTRLCLRMCSIAFCAHLRGNESGMSNGALQDGCDTLVLLLSLLPPPPLLLLPPDLIVFQRALSEITQKIN
jgi:hypothetical protein